MSAGPAAPCLFCRIARGEAPGALVLQTRQVPDPLIGPLWEAVRALARAVEAALEADGSFVAVNNRVSQSVPHLHVHVVPRRRGDGLRGFFWPRGHYRDAAEMEEVRRRLAAAVAGPA